MADYDRQLVQQWNIFYLETEKHVVPENDLVDHYATIDCWCQPIRDGSSVVHNSADDREIYEQLSWAEYRFDRTLN